MIWWPVVGRTSTIHIPNAICPALLTWSRGDGRSNKKWVNTSYDLCTWIDVPTSNCLEILWSQSNLGSVGRDIHGRLSALHSYSQSLWHPRVHDPVFAFFEGLCNIKWGECTVEYNVMCDLLQKNSWLVEHAPLQLERVSWGSIPRAGRTRFHCTVGGRWWGDIIVSMQ